MIDGHHRISLDSSPLIYFLEDDPLRAPFVEDLLGLSGAGGVTLVISAVTEAELLVGPLRAADPTAATVVRALLDGDAQIRVRDVTRSIAQEAALLRAEERLGLIDAIVVATALEERCTALVGNDRALRRIGDRLTYFHIDDLLEARRP